MLFYTARKHFLYMNIWCRADITVYSVSSMHMFSLSNDKFQIWTILKSQLEKEAVRTYAMSGTCRISSPPTDTTSNQTSKSNWTFYNVTCCTKDTGNSGWKQCIPLGISSNILVFLALDLVQKVLSKGCYGQVTRFWTATIIINNY